MKKICIITASIGKNLELSESIYGVFKTQGHHVEIINLVELDLPLYTSKAESVHKAEVLVAPFKEKLDAEALVFVAPEYNGGPPPVLSNFISWVSRSTKNWRETFNGKAGMIATASGGGGVHALMIIRMQLSFIGMNIIGRQIVSTISKPAQPEEIETVCLELLKAIPSKKI